MRKLYTTLVAILLTASVFAQSPEKISYQAVVRDASDNLTTNTQIGMQISILQGSASGTPVYVETQAPTTNANGLVSLEIGAGSTSDDFSVIDWANGPYFVKTETDPTGGTTYTITGTSQLLSVPYALHAKTAETVTGGITETDPTFSSSQAANITTTDITNLGNLSGSNTGDQDLSGLATKTALGDSTELVRSEIPDVSGLATSAELTSGLGAKANSTQLEDSISAVRTTLDLKAPIESPTFTGTVSGLDKGMVGLGNVDNTSDANKPVSSATQTALNLKAPIASPTFTGTLTAPALIAGSLTYPVADGDAGEFLSTDGSGTLSWATATVANNSIDGTKINLASNSTGDMMYYNGTDWMRVPAGSSGQVLQSNGTSAPTWETPAAGGSTITLVNTETSFSGTVNKSSTTVATITVPSTGKYLVTIAGLLTGVGDPGNESFIMQLYQGAVKRAGTAAYDGDNLEGNISHVLNLTTTESLTIRGNLISWGTASSGTLSGTYSLVKLSD
jgi:hypothetical protein